jgi:hypothetical protein
VNFGKQVLSHPLLVEAIESEFVACCIYNNHRGKDAKILDRYREPVFNNPVVRFVDTAGKDLIPRKDRVWSVGDVAARMTEALGKRAPRYLSLVATENAPERKTAVFAMHCFWEGEAGLGALAGVSTTRAGWLDGKEVVEVSYDATRISYRKLVKAARQLKCAAVPTKGVVKDAKLSDQLYYLRKSAWNAVPATPIQRVRMNAALARRQDPAIYLSPRQRKVAELVRKARVKKLEGMEPPPDPYALGAYEQKLRKRIAE